MITIYTDGACSGNPGIGGWGVVILYENKDPIYINGGEEHTTNNRMELTAAIKALGYFNGKKNLITVPLTSSNSIPHQINGRFGAAKLILRPSAPGSGVIAGSSIRTVLELAGVKNILAKQLGSNNLLNNARATINGLSNLRSYSA